MSERKPDYSDLEKILFRGFLSISADIGGIPVVFKTINSFESDLIDEYVPFNLPKKEKLSYKQAYSLAYSVFLFNGVNVLKDRDYYIPELAEAFLDIPKKIKDKTAIRLRILNKKSNNELKKVKAYSYGAFSRQKWASVKGTPINDPRITGLQGTQFLSLNAHQQSWVSLNTMEDDKEDGERLWDMAKFQASAHNPKGVKKIYAKDKTKKREEFRKRRALFETEGRAEFSDGSTLGEQEEVKISHESVKDLNKQLKNAMHGEKDFHDQVVESHERQVKESFNKEKQRRLRKKQIASQNHKEKFKGTEAAKDQLIFFDEDDVEKEIHKQRKRKSKKLQEGHYQGNRAFLEKENRLSKWGITEGQQGPKHVEPKEVDRLAEKKKENTSSVEGTVLEDYYQTSKEDLKNPDNNNDPNK